MAIKWQCVLVKTKASVLFQWYVFKGHQQSFFRRSLGLNFGLKNQKIVDGEISIDLNEFNNLEKLLHEKIKKERDFLSEYIADCYKYANLLLKTSHQLKNQSYNLISNSHLLDLYLSYQQAVLNLVPFLNSILVLDTILKKEIINYIVRDLEIVDKSKQEILLNKLLIPNKNSFFVQETQEIVKIALLFQEHKKADINKHVEEYLDKFAWINEIAYVGKFLTKKDVYNKLNKLIKEDIPEKIKKAKQVNTKKLIDYKIARQEINSSPKLIYSIEKTQEFIYLLTYRLDVFFLSFFIAYPLFAAISEKLGLSVDELVSLTGDEIVNYLKGKKVPHEEILRRLNKYALILENNKFTLLSGSSAPTVSKTTLMENEVRGMIANRGRVKGRAKVIYGIDDIEKVKLGDIVISPMTEPALVPALIKAAGIITDFGGILSHAAIVSREFGIPCIVGTEKATRVFKDGDLIELNAYDGVARKISK